MFLILRGIRAIYDSLSVRHGFMRKSVVGACLMRFGSCFGAGNAWSFSMVLEVAFLWLCQVANGVLNLMEFDGVKNLD